MSEREPAPEHEAGLALLLVSLCQYSGALHMYLY